MKIETVQDAFDRLADIVWWMKGFAAARPPAIDESDGSHLSLQDNADKLRIWIYDLASGRQRRLAYRDQERIIITLAELEQMRDGLEPLQEGAAEHNIRIVEQRERGYLTALNIVSQYAVEERSASDEEVPF
jgi:hypothetical protein